MAVFGDSLYNLIGRVKDVKNNAPASAIVRALNDRIKLVTARRAWSDLIAITTQNYPAPYNTGTISIVPNSNIVVGSGTAWPLFDYINTESAGQFPVVRQPGYQRVTPASMVGIVAGQWLYVDGPQGPEGAEAVCPVWTDAISFIAKFALTHDAGFPIQASSFAGLQIQPAYPLATITAVVDAETLLIDQYWGGPEVDNIAYNIFRAYISPDPTCWRIVFANDPVQGIPIDVDSTTYGKVLIADPQLTTSLNPTVIVPTPFLAGGGVAQWLTYPLIFQAYYLNLIIAKTWPKLVQDNDRTPEFLDSNLFVAGARADVLRQRVLLDGQQKDPYFDPQLAATFEADFNRLYDAAEDRDESISHHKLQDYRITVTGGYSPNYLISHPPWPSDAVNN